MTTDGNMDMDFHQLSEKSLKGTLKSCNVDYIETATKNELINELKKTIKTETFHWVKTVLDQDGKISESFKVKPTELIAKLTEIGSIKEILEEFSEPLLKMIMKDCDLDEEASENSKSDMVLKIEDEIFMQGLFKILHKLSSDSLKSYCDDLSVSMVDKKEENINNILNAMCNLEDTSAEPQQPTKPTSNGTSKKPAASKSKKPAAASSKKPAATIKKPTAKTPPTTTTTTTTTKPKTTNGIFKDDLPSATDKRARKPLQPSEPTSKQAATNSRAKPAAKTKQGTKRKLEPVADVSDDEEEEEEQEDSDVEMQVGDKKKGISGRNEAGGYYQHGKYVSPSLNQIKKGVTTQNLNDWYNLDDIKEYCKKHGLPQGLTKSKLIKNIVQFLNGTYKAKLTLKEKSDRKKKAKEERENVKRLKLEEKAKETTA